MKTIVSYVLFLIGITASLMALKEINQYFSALIRLTKTKFATLVTSNTDESFFLFFFYISTKNLQYILLNNTTYKLLYPTTTTIPFGAKTTSTSWLQITGNTNIELHVTTRKTKIAQELHVTNCTGKKKRNVYLQRTWWLYGL